MTTSSNNQISKFWHKLLSYFMPALYQRIFWDNEAEKDVQQAVLTGVKDIYTYNISGRFSLAYLQNHINLQDYWHVLDYGCGDGRVTQYLAEKVSLVSAADISSNMLKLLKTKLSHLENIRTVHIKSHSLKEMRTESFDLIFSMLVLQHMNKKTARKLMRHLFTKLKLNGFIFFQFPSERLRSSFPDLYNRISETDSTQPGLARLYKPNEIEEILHENLISPIKIEFIEDNYYVSGQKISDKANLEPLPRFFVNTFHASIIIKAKAKNFLHEENFKIDCLVQNKGNVVWINDDNNPINFIQLGVRLFDAENRLLIRDYARASLPEVLDIEKEASLTVLCPAINEPAKYILQFDMVNEGNFWFQDKGSKTSSIQIEII